MRILILSFYYEPDLSAGSFRTTSLIKELSKQLSQNDTVDIITTMPNRYKSFMDKALEFEEKDNIKTHRINLGTHKGGFLDQSILFIKFALNVIKIVRLQDKYDVIYATSGRLMTAFLGALIANKQKSRLVLDIRDIFVDTLKSVFKNSKLKFSIPFIKIIERYTVNSANHINLVSKGFEQYFMSINNEISYSYHTNGIDDIFLKYNFEKGNSSIKKIITYAGNIGEGQGLEKIIPIMAKKLGATYEIHIVGDGGIKYKLIQELNGIKNVKLFDPVNREKLLEIYKNSDFLFLHLNDYEAFKKVLPSKLFEYAATNKYIIAGVSGYAKEFIEENITHSFVFNPCDIDCFYNKFININKDIHIDRKEFNNNFKRNNIMNKLSKKIYSQ